MAAGTMSQSDRHLFAHSDPDRAGRSVASTPTASRTATPTSVTPEQSDAFGMASRASGQESTFISTPRAWPRSRSTTVASGRSGAARESDPLAVLFASFPVPPVTEEDMLLRLERMLRPANGRHLFNLRPSNLRPPPDHPLPPLPPIPRDLEPSLDFEPAKLHTDALGLALTYAPPFRPTRDSGEATSSFTVGFSTFFRSQYTASDALRESVSSGQPSFRDPELLFLLRPVRLPQFLCHAFRHPQRHPTLARVGS